MSGSILSLSLTLINAVFVLYCTTFVNALSFRYSFPHFLEDFLDALATNEWTTIQLLSQQTDIIISHVFSDAPKNIVQFYLILYTNLQI